MNVADAARAAIGELLVGYVRTPAMHLREAGFQSALYARVQNAIGPEDALLPVSKVLAENGGPLPHRYVQLQVGRVHREIELLGEDLQNVAGQQDLVILDRRSAPTLFCTRQGGATDFKQWLMVKDVAVAVEIKALPSNWANKPNAPEACLTDLQKLRAIKLANPEVETLFVLLDKSLSFPSARSAARPPVDWSGRTGTTLVCAATGDRYVEVWDLDENTSPLAVRRRFWML